MLRATAVLILASSFLLASAGDAAARRPANQAGQDVQTAWSVASAACQR